MDNWLFLLLIAMAVLFRLLASKVGESKKDSQEEPGEASTSAPPPLPRPHPESDEERIRKFLEALGVPTTSPPPPPVAPKPMELRRAADKTRDRVEELRRAAERKAQVLKPRPHIPPLTTFPPPIPVEEESAPPGRAISSPETKRAPMAEPWQRPEAKMVVESPVFKVGEVTVVAPPLEAATETPITLPPLTSYEAQTFAPTVDRSLSALVRSPEGLRHAIMLREIFGPPRSLQPLELVGSA